MQIFIRKVSRWLYQRKSFVHKWRAERMRAMVRKLKIPKKARIIDLGGSEFVWRLIDHDFHVTLINLPGLLPRVAESDRFTIVEADACHLRSLFPDHSFDVAFSNSTIEHVGDQERQALFAAEVRRLAPAYWVQTPSSRFPIEIHTGVPGYWELPSWIRARLHRNWQRKLPEWCAMIKETRILTLDRMRELFPDGKVFLELRFGFEKSYALYRPHD